MYGIFYVSSILEIDLNKYMYTGEVTTVLLTFGNDRPETITMRPKAILVRYEPSIHSYKSTKNEKNRENENEKNFNNENILDIDNDNRLNTKNVYQPFRVNPDCFTIKPGMNIYVYICAFINVFIHIHIRICIEIHVYIHTYKYLLRYINNIYT
jgi:hypothetical protein